MRRSLLFGALLVGGLVVAGLVALRLTPGETAKPQMDLNIAKLVEEGASLQHPYRTIWQEHFFAKPATDEGHALRICTADDQRKDCDFHSLDAALEAVRDGQMLILSPGVYHEAGILKANSVTLRAEPGARVEGRAVEGKAALVIKGDDTIVQGLECSGIKVPDRNGACIRLEGHNLTLQGVYFHNSQQSLLTGRNRGTVTVEDSLFEHMVPGGLPHSIYIGGGSTSFVVRRSHFLNGDGEGHGIKSRASHNLIEHCVIAALDHVDSRAIDLPEGGRNIIRDNIIQNGVNSSNQDVIGVGLELHKAPADQAAQQTEITGNLFILDRFRNSLVHARDVPTPVFKDNVVVGGAAEEVPAGNTWIRSRREAGIGPGPDPLAGE